MSGATTDRRAARAMRYRDTMRIADVADVGDAVQIDAELPLSGVTIELKDVSIADARRRWADLLRRMYEVDPLQCRPAAVSTRCSVRSAAARCG